MNIEVKINNCFVNVITIVCFRDNKQTALIFPDQADGLWHDEASGKVGEEGQ